MVIILWTPFSCLSVLQCFPETAKIRRSMSTTDCFFDGLLSLIDNSRNRTCALKTFSSPEVENSQQQSKNVSPLYELKSSKRNSRWANTWRKQSNESKETNREWRKKTWLVDLIPWPRTSLTPSVRLQRIHLTLFFLGRSCFKTKCFGDLRFVQRHPIRVAWLLQSWTKINEK